MEIFIFSIDLNIGFLFSAFYFAFNPSLGGKSYVQRAWGWNWPQYTCQWCLPVNCAKCVIQYIYINFSPLTLSIVSVVGEWRMCLILYDMLWFTVFFAVPVMHCILSWVYFCQIWIMTVEWNELTSYVFIIINVHRGWGFISFASLYSFDQMMIFCLLLCIVITVLFFSVQ